MDTCRLLPWMWPDRHVSVNLTSGRKSRGASHIMRRTFAVGLVPPPCLAFGAHPLSRLGFDPLTQGDGLAGMLRLGGRNGGRRVLWFAWSHRAYSVCARTFCAILGAITAACQSSGGDVRFSTKGPRGGGVDLRQRSQGDREVLLKLTGDPRSDEREPRAGLTCRRLSLSTNSSFRAGRGPHPRGRRGWECRAASRRSAERSPLRALGRGGRRRTIPRAPCHPGRCRPAQ